MKNTHISSIIVGILIAGSASPSLAITINFDEQGLTGPSIFVDAGPAQVLNIPTSVGNVNFQGGVILTNTTNSPANQTSIYGTADFGDPTLQNPLTITFENPITNFFLDVYNGLTTDVNYTVADNMGNSAMFTLPPNLDSGSTQIGFAATGTIVTITGENSPPFDFFIDNVTFNEPLPPEMVPEPTSTLSLLALGTLGLGSALKRNKKQQKSDKQTVETA